MASYSLVTHESLGITWCYVWCVWWWWWCVCVGYATCGVQAGRVPTQSQAVGAAGLCMHVHETNEHHRWAPGQAGLPIHGVRSVWRHAGAGARTGWYSMVLGLAACCGTPTQVNGLAGVVCRWCGRACCKRPGRGVLLTSCACAGRSRMTRQPLAQCAQRLHRSDCYRLPTECIPKSKHGLPSINLLAYVPLCYDDHEVLVA